LIKNKTRLLEKELLHLDSEINSLSSNLNEASLDFQYLTTPKHISLLAENFLYENFSYYKEFQIKKLKNYNTFSQLSTEKSVNKKSNITKEIDNRQSQGSKEIVVSKKVHNWMGLQIIKSLLGIPAIPVK